MRVNVYAEEMTDRVEVVEKSVEGNIFTGIRFYLELPVTVIDNNSQKTTQVKGPFMHDPDDDDSSAITFWGKHDLRDTLAKALDLLDEHYGKTKHEDNDE